MIPFSAQMQRWATIAGRSLTKFEQMSIARPFKYSKYWRSWSRLIKPVYDGYPLGFIELNLTPIINSGETWFTNVQPKVMRGHLSMADKQDIFEAQLPEPEFDALVVNVGYEDAMFMLQCDLWPMMDLEKFVEAQRRNAKGGGVPFHEFRLRGTEGMTA